MFTKEDRERAAMELMQRTKESYEMRDDSGMYGGVLKEGSKKWLPKAGKHFFDIVPYMITENHPLVIRGKKKAGSWDYVLVYHRHGNVGATRDQVLCLAKTYGRPCPICEEGQKQWDNVQTEEQKKEWRKKYSTSKRNLYNVAVGDTEEEWAKGVQVYDVADFYMESKLSTLAQAARTGPITYAHFDLGKTIGFTINNDEMKTIDAHVFEDRVINGEKYVIPDEFLNAAYVLEDLLTIPTYEQVAKMFWGEEGTPVSQGTQEAPTNRLRGQAPATVTADAPPPSRGEARAPAAVNCVMGVDIDKLDICQTCDKYNECSAEYERRKTEVKPETTTQEPVRARRRT